MIIQITLQPQSVQLRTVEPLRSQIWGAITTQLMQREHPQIRQDNARCFDKVGDAAPTICSVLADMETGGLRTVTIRSLRMLVPTSPMA